MERNFPDFRGTEAAAVAAAPQKFAAAVSPAMRSLERVALDVAASDIPVLIVGESGTGKRGLAMEIHRRSPRGSRSFTDINCAGISGEQFMRQLLSGNAADAGTVFLSEIGEIGAALQPKLLRGLSDGNGVAQRVIRARIIASTRKNLEQEIQAGRFREDLYYRLSGVCLRVPPLRHRREDVAALCEFFLGKYCGLLQRPKPVLSAHIQRFFQEYSWPGNVRELEDVLKMIVALGDERLALAGLRSHALDFQRGNGAPEKVSLKQAARAASRQAERELILKVLTRTRWNRKRAAQELQISYKALLYKLKQIGLDDEFSACEEINV